MSQQVIEKKPARRKRDVQGTREALLRAGTELFALGGFDGVSVEDIAARAGVNKALINYHFRGKRGLYLALLRSTLSACVERMAALTTSQRSPKDLLCEFVANFHRMATVDRPFFPALLLREVLAAGRTFDEEIAPEVAALFAVVREIIERGIREGAFRRVNPFLAHIGIVGSLVFFYATEPTRRRIVSQGKLPVALPSSDEFLRHMQGMVTRALAADPPGVESRCDQTGERS
jgi:AcrR family transcriptional regulator